jgi:hypothetical protein
MHGILSKLFKPFSQHLTESSGKQMGTENLIFLITHAGHGSRAV